jgi:hypothetical protein
MDRPGHQRHPDRGQGDLDEDLDPAHLRVVPTSSALAMNVPMSAATTPITMVSHYGMFVGLGPPVDRALR